MKSSFSFFFYNFPWKVVFGFQSSQEHIPTSLSSSIKEPSHEDSIPASISYLSILQVSIPESRSKEQIFLIPYQPLSSSIQIRIFQNKCSFTETFQFRFRSSSFLDFSNQIPILVAELLCDEILFKI